MPVLQAILDRLLPSRVLKLATGAVAGVLLFSGPSLVTCEQLSEIQAVEALQRMAGLHWVLLGGCMIAAISVFALLLHSILSFRSEPQTEVRPFRRKAAREVMWALIPVAIVVGLAIPAVQTVGLGQENGFLTPGSTSLTPGYRCHASSGGAVRLKESTW